MEFFSYYFSPNSAYWRKKDLKQAMMYLFITLLFGCILYVLFWPTSLTGVSISTSGKSSSCFAKDVAHMLGVENCGNNGASFSKPVIDSNWIEYRIAIVADLDEEKSKVPGKKNKWRSFYREGLLKKHFNGEYSVSWKDENHVLITQIAEKGRGLELSELVVFNEKLFSVDDRTGIVYQIRDKKAVPWVILPDGDGSVSKGFKGEWMTVKDNTLYVGGLGKEWTTPTGELVNFNPQYVKSIGPSGDVVHHNWRSVYESVKNALGIKSPGYVIHEAVMWSNVKRRWFFLPRRASLEKYDDQADEKRAANVLLSCNESFEDFTVTKIGELKPTHGFSSLKFVPGTNDDMIVALRSVEDSGNISTYIMVFKVDGTIVMDESFIDNDKYEGVEFI